MLARLGVGRRPAPGEPAALRASSSRATAAPNPTGCSPRATRSAPLRAAAARLNPDLIASGEGGSNLTLVRPGGRPRRDRRAPRAGDPRGRARAPRDGADPDRAPASASPTCTRPTTFPSLAVEDVLLAARAATEFAGEAPLLFGGDLNLRPRQNPEVFAELAERFGLAAPDRPRRDRPPARPRARPSSPLRLRWPPERRELDEEGLALRLSDHAPVEARFETARAAVVR